MMRTAALLFAFTSFILASAFGVVALQSESVKPIKTEKVVIAGGGLAGLLFANFLVRRPNYEVHLYERRPDPRHIPPSELRTYPISLQRKRGILALEQIPGLLDAVVPLGGWMKAGHFRNSAEKKSTTRSFAEPLLSLDRNQLTLVLLQHLLKVSPASNSSIRFHFDTQLQHVALHENKITVFQQKREKTSQIQFDRLVAADGARSVVRQTLADQGKIKFDIKTLPIDAKSLSVPRCSPNGFCLERGKFHGWAMAGGTHALAIPVSEDLCSGAISFPQNNDPMSNMTTADEVIEFFKRDAPKSLSKLVSREEAERLLQRPIIRIHSLKCDRLHVEDKVLLLGDAGHAVSNLLGQGANSALQDVQLFCGLLDRFDDNWSEALPVWTEERLACAHAVQEMSEYTTPPTPRMMREFRIRTKLRNLVPRKLAPLLFGHDAMQLLADTDLSYSEILRKTRWWSDRCKKVILSTQQSTSKGR